MPAANAINGTTPINCTVQIKDTTNILGTLNNTAGAPLTSQADDEQVDATTGDASVDTPALSNNELNDMLVRIVAQWSDMIGANCPIKNIFIKLTV